MNSSLGKLNAKDLIKGAWMAAYTGLLGAVYLVVQNDGLDFSSESIETVKTAIGLAVLGYLIKNTTSDQYGNVLGLGSTDDNSR